MQTDSNQKGLAAFDEIDELFDSNSSKIYNKRPSQALKDSSHKNIATTPKKIDRLSKDSELD